MEMIKVNLEPGCELVTVLHDGYSECAYTARSRRAVFYAGRAADTVPDTPSAAFLHIATDDNGEDELRVSYWVDFTVDCYGTDRWEPDQLWNARFNAYPGQVIMLGTMRYGVEYFAVSDDGKLCSCSPGLMSPSDTALAFLKERRERANLV